MHDGIRGVIRGMVVLSLMISGTTRATAGPLDPFGFPLGPASSPSAAGTYTFINDNGTPTLIGPGGTSITGTVSSGIAVFDFNAINIESDQILVGANSMPLALLLRSDFTLNGTIDVSGNGGAGGSPGTFFDSSGNGVGGSANNFGGGGGGGSDPTGIRGGPRRRRRRVRRRRRPRRPSGGLGGGPFGDSTQSLQGGGGGGGGGASLISGGNQLENRGGLGGRGGGAIEIGALGNINIGGNGIMAGGGDGSPGSHAFVGGSGGGGGGGSGGGIFLHGNTLSLSSRLEVVGGGGGFNTFGGTAGGGGGGGRVLVQVVSGAFALPGALSTCEAGPAATSAGPGSTRGQRAWRRGGQPRPGPRLAGTPGHGPARDARERLAPRAARAVGGG